MSFPQTRPTLIQRLADNGGELDWQEFLKDYWGPICQFASRFGNCRWQDAEDVASQTFLAIVQQQLLARWASARTAKLRTLLCTVVRYVLSNRARVQSNRDRIMRDYEREIADSAKKPDDEFYSAWADNLIDETINALLFELHCDGRGNLFRVLYGKICEGLTIAEVAPALGLTANQADQSYKDVRKLLAQRLEASVRSHVGRYSNNDDFQTDFAIEWADLARYLKKSGGIENAVRRVSEQADHRSTSSDLLKRTAKRLSNSQGPPTR